MMAAMGGKQTLAFVQQSRVKPGVLMSWRNLETPAGGQPKIWNYCWQNFVKMLDVHRLEEVISRRRFAARPNIPPSCVRRGRVTKAINGPLA